MSGENTIPARSAGIVFSPNILVIPMLNPYLLMVVLFSALAALAALDASMASLGLLPFLSGLRWLRVHFITLGVVTEAVFGLAAALVAARSTLARPKTRWDIWILLNGGLLILLVGIPLINQALILAGGTLVFGAAALLIHQLAGLRQTSADGALRQSLSLIHI